MKTEQEALKTLRDEGILPDDLYDLLRQGASTQLSKADVEVANKHDVLVFLIDKSPSIAQRGLLDGVIKGQNDAIDALAGADSNRSILFAQFLFDEGLQPLQPLVNFREPGTQTLAPPVVKLDRSNYAIGNGTAIRDAVLASLRTFAPCLVTQQEEGFLYEFRILVITDGEDVSSKFTAAKCKKFLDIARSLPQPLLHQIILLGIGDYNYQKTGTEMGIPPNKILTCNADPKAIREAIVMASRQVIP